MLTLLSVPSGERDAGLSHQAREAVIAAIMTDTPVPDPPGPRAAAIRLRAFLPEAATPLTPGEQALLAEWLDRIAAG